MTGLVLRCLTVSRAQPTHAPCEIVLSPTERKPRWSAPSQIRRLGGRKMPINSVLQSMIFPRGTRVKSIQTGYKGTVLDYTGDFTITAVYTIQYDKLGIRKNQPQQYIEALPNALNYLRVHKPTEDEEAAITYLLSPAAKLKLSLEARNADVDMA